MKWMCYNFQRPGSPKWRLVPTRREQEKWDRAAKAATGGSVSDSYQSFLVNKFLEFHINIYFAIPFLVSSYIS